jgi:hypothetical protein
MFRVPWLRYQLWGALGLIVVDATAAAPLVRQDRYYDAHPLVVEMKQVLMRREASAELPHPDPHP